MVVALALMLVMLIRLLCEPVSDALQNWHTSNLPNLPRKTGSSNIDEASLKEVRSHSFHWEVDTPPRQAFAVSE